MQKEEGGRQSSGAKPPDRSWRAAQHSTAQHADCGHGASFEWCPRRTMDPQSQSFTPSSVNSNTETWRLQGDVVRVQQVQAEHAERIARLERRQDEDARVKSVWGNQSPFPSVLSTGGAGGTPNQGMFLYFAFVAWEGGGWGDEGLVW